jgi:hypothetical protein
MKDQSMPPLPILLKRVLISLAIGLVVGIGISEITFLWLKETARAPKAIYLTIPPGTADSVARGQQPPSIPENMVFVVGDILIVENEDSVDHQFGPLWIPSGAAAHVEMLNVESLIYECTFQTGNYFGFEVREPLTLATRIYGILFAGVPLGVLIAIYSIIIPGRKESRNDAIENV